MEAENTSSSDESMGVGTGGKGGRGKHSASSSSKPAPVSTKKFTPGDDEWPKDLPPSWTKNQNLKDWCKYLSTAVRQGKYSVCWAVSIAKCIQALYAIEGIQVELSPQHLINNISSKSNKNGQIIKYEEICHFLKSQGLVEEKVCKFTGNINEKCSRECSHPDNAFYKIKEFERTKKKSVKEEDLILLVNKRPVVAVIECYQSFLDYKGQGLWKGKKNSKEDYFGRHAVLVVGFGTTQEGEHYWLIQNSDGEEWGDNGKGKIIRQCSSNNKESLFVNVIDIQV